METIELFNKEIYQTSAWKYSFVSSSHPRLVVIYQLVLNLMCVVVASNYILLLLFVTINT